MIAGLLALPGIDQAAAEQLAAAGRTLEDILAKALPRRARRSGMHHDLAIELSLKALAEVKVELQVLTDCGRCGGPMRESDGTCPSCGTRVFLGESITSLDAALRAADGDARGLDLEADFAALPEAFRAELEQALGPIEAEDLGALDSLTPDDRLPPELTAWRPDVEAETQRLLSRGTRRRR